MLYKNSPFSAKFSGEKKCAEIKNYDEIHPCVLFDIKQSGDWLQVLFVYQQNRKFQTTGEKFCLMTGDRLAALFGRICGIPVLYWKVHSPDADKNAKKTVEVINTTFKKTQKDGFLKDANLKDAYLYTTALREIIYYPPKEDVLDYLNVWKEEKEV